MHLSYNGVTLDILKLSDHDRVRVMTPDGSQYLYDEVNIRCQCVINPDATNLDSIAPTGPGGRLVNLGKNTCPNIYLQILSRLKEDRKTLKLWMDSEVGVETILESPLPGMTTDFKFGPKCVVHHLDSMHGNGSLWLDLEFTTAIGCELQEYCLANRWQWRVEHDPETFCATHVIEGMAHFRMDKMIKDKVTPDQLRRFFIFPVATGFKRQPPTIVMHPGGDACDYQIIDTEQILNLPGAQTYGAVSIEVEEVRNYSRPYSIVD